MLGSVARMHRLGARVSCALVLAWAAAGCGGPRVAPPAPPGAPAAPPAAAAVRPRPRPAPGYDRLRDSLGAVDASVLRGRRIVLDPGHGGWFRGCIGVGGTTEAEVNLGVALSLDSLLRAQGALVKLTRDRDRDFLTRSDSTLKSDLAERAAIANAFQPDLFVSIHHNADPSGAHDVNETQVYWQLGDDGPSYDAATDLQRALARNVGIATQKLLPGNFAVVRGTDAAAVLSEASHLTNPDVEAKLRTPEARLLEAEALYLGIARFFARRAPVVEHFDVLDGVGRAREHTGPRPRLQAVVRGPFDVATLRVDGAEVPGTVVPGGMLAGAPLRPLEDGAHVATLAVRLAGEGSARTLRRAFTVHSVPAAVTLAAAGYGARDGGALALDLRAVNAEGLPCTAPLRARLRVLAPSRATPRETTLVLRDGHAPLLLRVRGARPDSLRVRVMLASDTAVAIPTPLRRGVPVALAIPREPVRVGRVHRMPEDVPLRDAPSSTGARPALAWLDRDGVAVVPADPAGRAATPQLAGFRTWGADTAWPPRVTAIASGALVGRRIVLDPEGGGDDAAGTGPSGTRASTLNLDVARALQGMLEAAGAQVTLTRTSDASVSEMERVQVGEAFGAERYLRIGHAAAPPVAGHYYASGGGRRWGGSLARACAALGLADSLPVAEATKYPLTQSSAVALYASLERVDTRAGEARLLAPGALRAEAYALFCSLAAEFAPEAANAWTSDSLELRSAAGVPRPGVPVRFGGGLLLQSGPDGRVRFLRTEAGPMPLEVADPAFDTHPLLLDSEHGRVLTGTR